MHGNDYNELIAAQQARREESARRYDQFWAKQVELGLLGGAQFKTPKPVDNSSDNDEVLDLADYQSECGACFCLAGHDYCMGLNDDEGKSFSEIADYIEANL